MSPTRRETIQQLPVQRLMLQLPKDPHDILVGHAVVAGPAVVAFLIVHGKRSLPSRLIPQRHRPGAELLSADELQVEMLG